jgi:hypothetical protein
LILPSALDHPAGQVTQARFPFSNFPAGHALDVLHTPSLLQPSAVQPLAMATDEDPPTAMEPASGLLQLVFPWFLWSHPLGQLEQASGLVLPEVLENLPGWHGIHPKFDETPVADEYLPGPHKTHSLSFCSPSVPLHRPEGHSMQLLCSEFPDVFEYLPAEQAKHSSSLVSPLWCDHFPAEQRPLH